MKSSSTILIVLVAVGVAVADVSELGKRYLPPSAAEIAIAQDFSVTEAPAEVTTTSAAGTTVVEIEQVPLEEMHYNEQPQQEQEQVQATEQPSLPSLYEQPPALIYEAPIYEAQTDAPVVAVEPVEPVAAVDPVAAVAPAEEAPVIEEATSEKAQEAPVSEEIIVVEDVPRADEAAEILDAVLSDPLTINDLVSAVDPAVVAAPEDAPIVKETAAEVPLVEAEPEPAHVLGSDGYRYKTANRFRYRF